MKKNFVRPWMLFFLTHILNNPVVVVIGREVKSGGRAFCFGKPGNCSFYYNEITDMYLKKYVFFFL